MIANPNQEFLGVDVGSARVGIARGSGLARIAEPVKTVLASEALKELTALAGDNSATAIVVGLPRSLDGNDTDQTKLVRQWVESTKTSLSLDFYWQDEALTTVTAQNQNPRADDADAAAVILQDFLDAPEAERVPA